MSLQDFYKAEQLAEKNTFDLLVKALLISCPDNKIGGKIKDIFPDQWEYVFRAYIAKRMSED